MSKAKFYDLLTSQGHVTVNINNIATIEDANGGAKVVMNVTNEDGTFITYNTRYRWQELASDITVLSRD